jgi:hypothetical protein
MMRSVMAIATVLAIPRRAPGLGWGNYLRIQSAVIERRRGTHLGASLDYGSAHR